MARRKPLPPLWLVCRDPGRIDMAVAHLDHERQGANYIAASSARTGGEILYVMRRRGASRHYDIFRSYIGQPLPLVIDADPVMTRSGGSPVALLDD